MPALIKTTDEIMRRRMTDVHFLQYLRACIRRRGSPQLAWLSAREIAYERAAPTGWLEGDPGCSAVFFDGHDDPRLAAYSATFEDAGGGSLDTGLHQLYLVPFD